MEGEWGARVVSRAFGGTALYTTQSADANTNSPGPAVWSALNLGLWGRKAGRPGGKGRRRPGGSSWSERFAYRKRSGGYGTRTPDLR